jgi:hypothetical protein
VEAIAEISSLITGSVSRPWLNDFLPNTNVRVGHLPFVKSAIGMDVAGSSASAFALVAGQVCHSFDDALSVLGLESLSALPWSDDPVRKRDLKPIRHRLSGRRRTLVSAQ